MIYQPAEDSDLLKEQVSLFSNGRDFLDMGSGSGIQAEAAINSGASSVLSVDINPESIALLRSKDISAIESDLFEKVTGKFDLIAFNPPYLPEDEREPEDSKLATTAGKEGDEIILRFLEESREHLNETGVILLLLSSLTPKERILELLSKLSYSHSILSKKKLFMESLEVWKINLNT